MQESRMTDIALPKSVLAHLTINLQQEQWQGSNHLHHLLELNLDNTGPHPLRVLWDRVHPQDREQLRTLLQAGTLTPAGASSLQHRLRMYTAVSESCLQLELEGFIRKIPDSTANEFIGSVQVLSAETKPEKTSHVQALLDYTEDMLAMLDCNLCYTSVNKAYAHLFGLSQNMLIGSTIGTAFAHDETHYLNIIYPILQDCLQGKTVHFERWVDVPGFGDLYLDIEYAPFRNAQGEIEGIAIVGRNRTEMTRFIDALKRNENLLNRTEHIANLGGWFFHLESEELQWTDEMYNIHEVDKDFVLNQVKINSFIPPEYLPEVLGSLALALAGNPAEVVAPLISAKGKHKWVRSISFPVIENGLVVSIEGILQDITELTSIQHKLQQSEETYRSLVEETNALVWEADIAPFGFTYMSPQSETITGYSASQWCSPEFLARHIYPEDSQYVFNTARRQIRQGLDFILEYRLERPDGSLMWLHDDIKIINDEYNNPVKLRGVMIDISQLKEMQTGLNRALHSLENHKYVLDQHAIVASTDSTGSITYVNEKFVEITGYEREELIGNNHRILQSGLHGKNFSEKMWSTISNGQVWQGEICNRSKPGYFYWVYTTIVPLTDENGSIEAYMSVSTDITELKRTEETLRRAQKMEAIGQLTGGIAHDFNNLLSIVIGNIELVEMVLSHEDVVRTQLESAKNAAIRGSVLTRRLLNFSHQTPISGKALDLNKVMKGLEVLISKSLTALVHVEMNLSADLWQVEVDPGDFEDVIINLAINASDAMPEGGKLSFFTRNYLVTHMEFKNKGMIPPGEYVEIIIKDTGVGMSEDIIEKIFEPYFSTKPSDKGSGLGLAMVYGFIQRSKGLIFVESRPGNGSCFVLLLPKSQLKNNIINETPILPKMENLTAKKDETILLVDDEVDILKISRINLTNLGYRVICCESGDEAMEVIKSSESIDLLFTDIVMPGKLNGYELAEAAISLRPALKVLFTTGYAKVEHKVTRKDWSKAMIQKPYRSSELSKKIRETLDQPSRK